MRIFPKPVIVASRCLEFDACRWNGVRIPDELVRKLSPHVDFRPVCPECEIGLGVPRDPIRVVQKKGTRRLIEPEGDRDVTTLMNEFSRAHLSSLSEVDGFILKGRSPSCGIKDVKIYPGPGNSAALAKGAGFFAAAVLERFPDLAVEDEGRLTNFKIREHFLIKLFALAEWRQVRRNFSMARLVSFHTAHKLLLMSYNQKQVRVLGKIVANRDSRPPEKIISEYDCNFKKAFHRAARPGSHINVMMHALGYFSKGIKPDEKRRFLGVLEKYRWGKAPLSSPLSILHSWIARFDQRYLAGQFYFEPYPEELAEISDSGKGRDY